MSFVAWALYAHDGELISLQGICLSQVTNNISKYIEMIELLPDEIDLGIRDLVVNLDS